MIQESTRESPFCFFYGRDPRLPTESSLCVPSPSYVVDVEDYRSELVKKLSRAWTIAREKIQEAQKVQKTQYDCGANESSLHVGALEIELIYAQ